MEEERISQPICPLLADIVAKVLEWRPESKFAQYSTLDRPFVESRMRVNGQVWNIFLAQMPKIFLQHDPLGDSTTDA
jgi:hypothetical protein